MRYSEGCLIEMTQTRALHLANDCCAPSGGTGRAFAAYTASCLPFSWRHSDGYEAIGSEEDATDAPPKARRVLGLPVDQPDPHQVMRPGDADA